MKRIPGENRLLLAALVISGLVLSVAAYFTEIPSGGADNYAHFNISRWAFRYPHLFLDHWGKPVFTLLSAPFAQAGMAGVRIFNIAAGLLSAWFAYSLAVRFNLRYAWFAAAVTAFTPIYLMMMSSGMTEVLFSLFMMAAVWLFFRGKYVISAVVISFLFLIRNEGILFILLFLAAFLIKRQYRAVPFLFSGFLIFSLIGSLYHYQDFWWLITKRPYSTGGTSVYGSGTWYHFFLKLPAYFGYIVTFFLYAGTATLIYNMIKSRWRLPSDAFLVLLLVAGGFWGYFAGHTYMWWKGDTSAGLVRVFAAVSPLVSVMALFFLNALGPGILRSRAMKAFLLLITVVLMGSSARHYHRSVSRDLSAEILKRTSQWLRKPENIRHKIVVHNPYFSYSTGIDAWDQQKVQYGFSNNEDPGRGLPDSTLFVWDAHFSANEGRMPLEQIMASPDFELVTWFEPVVPFQVLGGYDYRIYIFRKISGGYADNRAILMQLKAEQVEKGIYYSELIEYEIAYPREDMERQRIPSPLNTAGMAYSLMDAEFSPGFQIPAERLAAGSESKIRITFQIQLYDTLQEGQLLNVFSIEKDDKVLHYATIDVATLGLPLDKPGHAEAIFSVPPVRMPGAILKFYLWNIGRKNVVIDNFRMEIFRTTTMKSP